MIDTNITVITYNRPELTVRCIEALRQVTARPFHLTVVDNGSESALRDVLQRFHAEGFIDTLILHRRNMGVSVAGNAGWAATDHPYYTRVDNDIVVRHPGWLNALIERVEEGGFGAVAYKFCDWHKTETHQLPSGRFYEATEAVGAGCVVIPRRTHELLGFWNEDYLYGWEDLEYSNRVRLTGGKLADVDPTDMADHLGPPVDAQLLDYQQTKMARSKSTVGADALFLLNTTMFELNLRPLYVIRKFLPHLGTDGITTYTPNPEYKAIITRQNLFRKEFLEGQRGDDIHLKMPTGLSPQKNGVNPGKAPSGECDAADAHEPQMPELFPTQ